MAEAVTAIAQQVGSYVGSEAWKKIMFASDLETQLDGLREMKSFIEAALRNKDPFEVSTDVEGLKIKKLRAVNDKLGYLFDELAARSTRQEVMGGKRLIKEVRLFFSSSNQLATSWSTATKMKSIKKELDDFRIAAATVSSNNVISSSVGNPERGFNQIDCPLINPVVIGRDTDRDQIISQLCDSSNTQELVSVAAIVGIGGQGKTALAQYVCNDERVKACFDVRVWVPSSPYSSFRDIINKVIQYGTENAEPFNCGMPQLHPQLVGRKCLLVLDNIWYQEHIRSDWLKLKNFLQVGGAWAAGSKVLVTARSETVARIMDAGRPYTLRGLDKSDALLLLQECARLQGKIPDGAEAIEKEIVRLIPNVPLVIQNIGCQLAEKLTIGEWEAVKNQLASTPAIELNNEVLQTLKLSYDQLDEKLKRCVAYCCLFPDTNFDKDEMILYWIALGFVETSNEESLEEAGEEYVHRLVRHGFLHLGGSHFIIHDVMHELLASIGKSKHQMIDSTTKEIPKGVSHVSLCLDEDDVEDAPLSKLKDGQSLESILILRSRRTAPINVRLGLRIEKLASTFPHLKVLNLKAQGIEKVPSSIEELIHLRHLDLSQNPLRKLPNKITQLVKLLSLILRNCEYLEELPRDMWKLVNLRHLKVKGTDLRRMPKGFGSLTELRTLDMFVVEGKKGNVGATLGELTHLDNLEGGLSICVNGESKYVASEQMGNKKGLTGLGILFAKSALEDEMFLEGLQPNGENLKVLNIWNYGGKRLPTWMTDDRFPKRFPKLVHMNLKYREFERLIMNKGFFTMTTENYEDLPEWVPGYSRLMEQLKTGPIQLQGNMEGGNGLPALRNFALGSATLVIKKQLEPRSGGGSGQDILHKACFPKHILRKACFPKLHTLTLKDIPELEVLPEEFRDLSSLMILRIVNCPKLKELPRWIGSFSSLEQLFIKGATQLKTLPDSIGSLTSLARLWLHDCPTLESFPHQITNLPRQCSFDIIKCSTTLLEKCREPTGEYWPLIQHLQLFFITPQVDQFYH